jgi:hypothetical protein
LLPGLMACLWDEDTLRTESMCSDCAGKSEPVPGP